MKTLLIAICGVIIGLSLALSLSIAAADNGKTKSETAQTPIKEETQKGEPQKEEQPVKASPQTNNTIPVYKPPLRGAPAGRVAGGTRGADQTFPYLCLIVPEHVGLTVSSQPVLYFYQSKTSPYPVEFILIQEQGISPILETRIASPGKPGVQSIRLADYGVRLETGIRYKWFIALVPDAQHRSKDILAAGGIEFIEQTPKIKEELATAPMSQIPNIYAEAGIWYDAFHSLSSQIETSSDTAGLKEKQASLLEQIGLAQVTVQDPTE
ncbi:MAG: DUF928 domain-containing protein [Desulfobacula sp.]|nr:DUF928 domain-containing protein [Desulfobacula sp.]